MVLNPDQKQSIIDKYKLHDKDSGSAVPFIDEPPAQAFVAPRQSRSSQQAANRAARAEEEQQREKCRDRIRSQIDRINSQMRSGYTSSRGISLRNRRRDLEQRLREC